MAQLTYDESNDGECCGQQGCQHQKLEPPNNALANRWQIAAFWLDWLKTMKGIRIQRWAKWRHSPLLFPESRHISYQCSLFPDMYTIPSYSVFSIFFCLWWNNSNVVLHNRIFCVKNVLIYVCLFLPIDSYIWFIFNLSIVVQCVRCVYGEGFWGMDTL